MSIQVTLLDKMGSDLTVVNAARVSFAKQSEYLHMQVKIIDLEDDAVECEDIPYLSARDTSLINYLAKHGHWTPFAHPQVSFHVRAPIFVARQLAKHQVGLVWNEVSRRYVDEKPILWTPRGAWRSRPEGSIKQGSGTETIPAERRTMSLMHQCVEEYERLIRDGVAPEQARAVLPQATYTEWHWTGSLYAFSRICKLRMDAHAQQETQQVALQIAVEMAILFPVCWKALLGDSNG